eukprot:GHVP01069132.1.p1 GENE.GHVP01069132.1~~GHVP01069132.1.p1  ORF type:complete len:651 (-),score=85.21 GHVP01069132.1:3176-5128(-)
MFFLFSLAIRAALQIENPEELVDPFLGLRGCAHRESGNLPMVTLPFSRGGWVPQTRLPNTRGFIKRWFHPDDKRIYGMRFTHSHTADTEMPDWGGFLIGATFGSDYRTSWGYRSDSVVSKPYMFITPLFGMGSETSLGSISVTQGSYASKVKITWPTIEEYGLVKAVTISVFDTAETMAAGNRTKDQIFRFKPNFGIVQARTFQTDNSKPTPSFSEAFHLIFSEKWHSNRVSSDNFSVTAHVVFPLTTESVEISAGSSIISANSAEFRANSILDFSYEDLVEFSKIEWKNSLSHIYVDSFGDDLLESEELHLAKLFYTALYRVLMNPKTLNEQSFTGNAYYSPFAETLTVHLGEGYTGYNFEAQSWLQFPLIQLIWTDNFENLLNGMFNAKDDSGWVPKVCSLGFLNIAGDPAGPEFTMLDVILSKFYETTGIDESEAWGVIENNLLSESPIPEHLGSAGRLYTGIYMQNGFVPSSVEHSVSSQMMYILSDRGVSENAYSRGYSYLQLVAARQMENAFVLYNPETKSFRPMDENGQWLDPYNQRDWSSHYSFGAGNNYLGWDASLSKDQIAQGHFADEEEFCEELDSILELPPQMHQTTSEENKKRMVCCEQDDTGGYYHSFSRFQRIPMNFFDLIWQQVDAENSRRFIY